MTKKNIFIGIGMGLAIGGCMAMAMKPKKSCMKSAIGKTVSAVGNIADSISDMMGW